jgi:hypothetical protein
VESAPVYLVRNVGVGFAVKLQGLFPPTCQVTVCDAGQGPKLNEVKEETKP